MSQSPEQALIQIKPPWPFCRSPTFLFMITRAVLAFRNVEERVALRCHMAALCQARQARQLPYGISWCNALGRRNPSVQYEIRDFTRSALTCATRVIHSAGARRWVVVEARSAPVCMYIWEWKGQELFKSLAKRNLQTPFSQEAD